MVRTPAIYAARVEHARTERVRHGFSYRQHMWLVDLDALPRLPRPLRAFARFEARDHLGDPTATIRANVDGWLSRQGVDLRGGRIVMLANARSAGYVFNPLSLFWCYSADRDRGGDPACVIAEVHNTFGERHCYLLRPDDSGLARVDKQFYVSPFLAMGGQYVMRVAPPGDDLHVTIALRQGGATPFRASLRGVRRPVTWRSVLGCVLRHPFATYRVSGLIRYQGIRLFLRRVPVVRRPAHVRQEGVQ